MDFEDVAHWVQFQSPDIQYPVAPKKGILIVLLHVFRFTIFLLKNKEFICFQNVIPPS